MHGVSYAHHSAGDASLKIFAFAAAAIFTLAAPALAQDAPRSDEEGLSGDSVTVGVGLAHLPDYEGSNDFGTTPVPGIVGKVKGYSFLIAGNRAVLDLIANKPGEKWDIQAGPMLSINFTRSRINSIDDPRVRALGQLDRAVEVGGFVGIGKSGVITSEYDKLSFTVTYRRDVSGVHRSAVVTPTINYLTPLSRKTVVGAFISADHAGEGYTRTYFGITPAQSLASGLPVYTPGAGWKSVIFGGGAAVALTGDLLKGLKLGGGGSYARLIGDVGNAPIVRIAGSRGQWIGVLGLAYTF